MDIKIARNYAVYQNAVSNGRNVDKNSSVPARPDSKSKADEICISSDGVRKSEAAQYSSVVSRTMDSASPERIAALKQQIDDGTYQVSAELVARRLMSEL